MDDFRGCTITKNFTLQELVASDTATRMGIDNSPDEEVEKKLRLLATSILQPLRDRYGKPITVTSGYRCSKLNKAVGGVSTSQHLKGEAADLVTDDVKALFNLAKKRVEDGEIQVGQLIDEYGRWVHISLPDKKHKNQILHL